MVIEPLNEPFRQLHLALRKHGLIVSQQFDVLQSRTQDKANEMFIGIIARRERVE